MRHGPEPFVLAFITLKEGPTMLSNIVNCDPNQVEIAMPVKVKFVQSTGEFKVPMFELVS